MPLPLFSPAMAPTPFGTSNKVGVRQRLLSFGDGYEQRSEDGLNARPRSGQWTWAMLEPADAQAIIDFMSANALTGFRYTFPDEAVEIKYRIVGDIEAVYPNGVQRSVTIQVRQIFDP